MRLSSFEVGGVEGENSSHERLNNGHQLEGVLFHLTGLTIIFCLVVQSGKLVTVIL